MAINDFKYGIPTNGTDDFVKKGGLWIEFFHLPSSTRVKFKAYITSFNDSYNVEFSETDVYGRMDPIAIYKGTKRKITLGWTVVAESHEEAYENWRNVQTYIKMLYPSYNKHYFGKKGSQYFTTTLSSPPLLKMKFMNIIMNSRMNRLVKQISHETDAGAYGSAKGVGKTENTARDGGLLVVPGSLTVDPQFADRGALIYKEGTEHHPNPKVIGGDQIYSMKDADFHQDGHKHAFILPYEVTLTTDYTVLHEHDLGFERASRERPPAKTKASKGKQSKRRLRKFGGVRIKRGFKNFPYGIAKDERK